MKTMIEPPDGTGTARPSLDVPPRVRLAVIDAEITTITSSGPFFDARSWTRLANLTDERDALL